MEKDYQFEDLVQFKEMLEKLLKLSYDYWVLFDNIIWKIGVVRMKFNCTNWGWEDEEKELLATIDEYGSGKLETCPDCKGCWNLARWRI